MTGGERLQQVHPARPAGVVSVGAKEGGAGVSSGGWTAAADSGSGREEGTSGIGSAVGFHGMVAGDEDDSTGTSGYLDGEEGR